MFRITVLDAISYGIATIRIKLLFSKSVFDHDVLQSRFCSNLLNELFPNYWAWYASSYDLWFDAWTASTVAFETAR